MLFVAFPFMDAELLKLGFKGSCIRLRYVVSALNECQLFCVGDFDSVGDLSKIKSLADILSEDEMQFLQSTAALSTCRGDKLLKEKSRGEMVAGHGARHLVVAVARSCRCLEAQYSTLLAVWKHRPACCGLSLVC